MCFSFNLHKQKHLVLCNFKELYQQIKSKSPNYMIEFSQFPSLQPKWRVAIAAPGTQSVCVYSFHQTVVLLCSASRLKVVIHKTCTAWYTVAVNVQKETA